MRPQLQSLVFVFYASVFLFALFGISAFLLLNGGVEGSYRLVTVFLILILISNVIAITLTHE